MEHYREKELKRTKRLYKICILICADDTKLIMMKLKVI